MRLDMICSWTRDKRNRSVAMDTRSFYRFHLNSQIVWKWRNILAPGQFNRCVNKNNLVPSLHHLMILRAGGRSENLSGVGKVNTINLWTFFLNQLIPTKNIKYFTNFCPSLQKLEIQLLYFFGGIEGMKNMFLDLLTFSKETFTNYDEKKRWVGT